MIKSSFLTENGRSDPAVPIHVLYPIDQRAECIKAVAHESRIFCGLSFDFSLDLSGSIFAHAVCILPEHCRKAGAVLYFADVRAKILAECAKLDNFISLIHISLVAVIMS